ncbi:MAG: hypothetical protein GXY76_07340 [Chloroflexi bacterium]|nr:hypothetical protein [Chloroflexota bacterium]
MKVILGLAVVCFCVALAVFVGYRMSAEAMAVVIGVVCGVVASIPMSALILLLTKQRRTSTDLGPEPHWAQQQWAQPPQGWMPQRGMPPVVVIQGGQAMQRPEMMPLQAPMTATMPREFRVIGESWDIEKEDSRDQRAFVV